ncbi:Lrp/AsnC family transcriptional regulator [candidate division KSB1 bacterium]
MAAKINSKDMLILKCLRENSNQPLTDIAKETGIPVTTIYDRMRVQGQKVIMKYTVLVDFVKLGYQTKVKIALKVKKEDRKVVKEFLLGHKNLNSLFRINMGYDYLAEMIFMNHAQAHCFVDKLEEKFGIKEKQLFFVVDEIERERFLVK